MAARWRSRDKSSVYGVGVYGPLLSYESPCQVRELERGHPEEVVARTGDHAMTVIGVALVGGLPLYMPSPVITNPPPHPQSFLDELLSFSCLPHKNSQVSFYRES